MPKDVIVYEEQIFMSLETDSYFGDSAMDGHTTRNAAIIASENTEVAYLEMSLYHSHIQQEKIKLIHKTVRFFWKIFFHRINHYYFGKKIIFIFHNK